MIDVLSPLSLLVELDGTAPLNKLRSMGEVRAVVPYHPLFKLGTGLFELAREIGGEGDVPVVMGLYNSPDDYLLEKAQELSRTPIRIQPSDNVIFCRLSVPELIHLASDPAVSHISMDLPYGIDNNVAAGIIDVLEVWDTLGLDGSGQFVAIADTGLDTGLNSTLHPDFRGRVSSVYTYGRSGNWSDWDTHVWDPVNNQWDYKGGHGTHVAGSVLGNGTMSGGDISGMAPAASIVMQSTMTNTGSLSIPAYSRLFGDAYASKARVQTNSWSTRGVYGNYTWRSWQTDHFVWNNKDLVVLFSAGNNGGKGPYYVSTQASSKNVIAVGGSENYRPTLSSSANNISEMAYFSSQGYTWGDLRIKPDVVAPSTYILSTRSTIISDPANHYWRIYNGSYAYNGGTSMSTPIVAGMTALIRQYFEEMEDHEPSAALVKAAVLNGARPLNGQWSSIPNSNEGWGRVNLSNSLATEDSDAGSMQFIDNSTGLATGKTHSRLITVASNRSDLIITLVWSDYPGSNTSSKKLVNDLDLTLTSPDGTVYHGNDRLSPFNSYRDRNNNVERIRVASPGQGIYTLNVTGYSVTVGPQPYAVVLTGDLTRAVGKVYWEQEYVPANGTAADSPSRFQSYQFRLGPCEGELHH
jgi:subtilisin family serine protease